MTAHPDAAIMALERRIIFLTEAVNGTRYDRDEGRCDRLCQLLSDASQALIGARATTLGGITAKARIAMTYPDEPWLEVAASIAADLVAMDGGPPEAANDDGRFAR